MNSDRKKLIEVALPLNAINEEAAREKSIRHGHPSSLHLWWARRPLVACRAVLFAQLVDDPSAWPEEFPTAADQDRERQRIFRIIRAFVKWENSNNETVLDAARLEIARSLARGRVADGEGDERDQEVVAEDASPKLVRSYLAEVAPPVHDPFAGGGSIPLEAMRLGLRTIATDLNPIPVLLNHVLLTLFARLPRISPVLTTDQGALMASSSGNHGFISDVLAAGEWVHREARARIGAAYGLRAASTRESAEEVVAWLWARTVRSPDPAFAGTAVPLIGTFLLSNRKGRQVWLDPIVDRDRKSWSFAIREGKPSNLEAVRVGTKVGRGSFRCLLSGSPIPVEYIREQGRLGLMGFRMTAVVVSSGRGRSYRAPEPSEEAAAAVDIPENIPTTDLPEQALGFRVQRYGLTRHADLFLPRQLLVLSTFASLVQEAREKVRSAVLSAATRASETDAAAYADAVAVLLGLAVSKAADYNSTLVAWSTGRDQAVHVFGRHALPMVWDFAEVNPFGGAAGDPLVSLKGIARVAANLPTSEASATVAQASAELPNVYESGSIISTDPPYYDNVPYADLSDYFYVWLRLCLRAFLPKLFGTVLVPKQGELVAEPARFGGDKGAASQAFETGLRRFFERAAAAQHPRVPAVVFYAFKQQEQDHEGVGSSGWETMLQGLISAGFRITGTWPIRTEKPGRLRETGSNALASSIVLVCRKREDEASAITRADFRRLLERDLPMALRALQQGNIPPVDVAQASLGPGMSIFSRYSRVIEADGSPMSVSSALRLINETVDKARGEEEGALDPDTRFAVTWFESHGFEDGPYGKAETLATARAVSVSGVQEAGILRSAAGKVRLFSRKELPEEWDPDSDNRLTVWEATQHLIKRLDVAGEQATAALLAKLGPMAEHARNLAYRLYTTSERRGWTEEAHAYNGLILAWPELEKLAGESGVARGLPSQVELFE